MSEIAVDVYSLEKRLHTSRRAIEFFRFDWAGFVQKVALLWGVLISDGTQPQQW